MWWKHSVAQYNLVYFQVQTQACIIHKLVFFNCVPFFIVLYTLMRIKKATAERKAG